MSRRPPSSEVSAVIEMVRRRYCGDRVHGWFVGSDVRERAWNAVSATEQPPCPPARSSASVRPCCKPQGWNNKRWDDPHSCVRRPREEGLAPGDFTRVQRGRDVRAVTRREIGCVAIAILLSGIRLIRDTRIVPLDGREHIGSGIRSYFGDSRGRWEGDTLVLDVTTSAARPITAARAGQSISSSDSNAP